MYLEVFPIKRLHRSKFNYRPATTTTMLFIHKTQILKKYAHINESSKTYYKDSEVSEDFSDYVLYIFVIIIQAHSSW